MNLFIYIVECLFGLGLFINALLFVPQALKLLKSKNAEGLSLITFAGFNVMQILTMLHGYINEDYLLMFGFIPSFVFCGIVTSLIFLYRKKGY